MTSFFGPKVLVKLQQKKYRQEYGCFVVDGKKGVLDAVQSSAEVSQLIVSDAFAYEQREFCQQPEIQDFFTCERVLLVREVEFSRLVESATPQGIAAVVRIPHPTLEDIQKTKLIAVLEDIRDPGNLGTMIRTADWFGVDGLLLVGGADPYQPKVVRSTMGSLFHVPLVLSQNISTEVAQLKQSGFQIVVTRPEVADQSLSPAEVAGKLCVVFGNESEGTSEVLDRLADRALSIPKFGSAESLNVAVSFGIVMSDIRG